MNRLTKILAGVVCVLSLQSCADQFYSTDPYRTPDARLTDIAIPAHNKNIELFFIGEAPKEEYVKVAAIEARGPEFSSYGSLIKHLRTSAQKFGADAILVMDKEYKANVSSWIYTNRAVSTDNIPELRGIAIKYRKNLDLTQIPKEQEIHFYDPGTNSFEPALHLKLTFGGEIQEKEEFNSLGIQHYTNFIKNYSMQHLLHEQGPKWRIKEANGRITHRQLRESGLTIKKVLFKYNPDNKVEEIQIQHMQSETHYERIFINYDTNGNIAERTVFKESTPYLREVYYYNHATGAVDAIETFLINQDRESPFLKSAFTYYAPDEVK